MRNLIITGFQILFAVSAGLSLSGGHLVWGIIYSLITGALVFINKSAIENPESIWGDEEID